METASKLLVVHPPTKRDPFCVVWKGDSIPSAPLREGEDSALNMAVKLFPCLDEVEGNSARHFERGLIHRLDTSTKGLLLIAATQEAYAALKATQKQGLFKKTYRAAVERSPNNALLLGGFPPAPAVPADFSHFTVSSRFRPYGEKRRAVRPVTEESGRASLSASCSRVYTTAIECIKGGIAVCSLTAGFRHQVRCHLSWLGLPVQGDALYNPHNDGGGLQFECTALSFLHPITGQTITIECSP